MLFRSCVERCLAVFKPLAPTNNPAIPLAIRSPLSYLIHNLICISSFFLNKTPQRLKKPHFLSKNVAFNPTRTTPSHNKSSVILFILSYIRGILICHQNITAWHQSLCFPCHLSPHTLPFHS